jgi:hypothetical protein
MQLWLPRISAPGSGMSMTLARTRNLSFTNRLIANTARCLKDLSKMRLSAFFKLAHLVSIAARLLWGSGRGWPNPTPHYIVLVF